MIPFGRLWAAAAAVVLLALAVAPARAAPTFPQLTGRVVDDAHVLSPATQAQLTEQLAALEAKTSRQLVVVTLPSLGGYDIADYGYQLGRAWGVGQKGLNNGVLFIVAPSEHKVRIEVGYGLEPIVTDALSSVILQQQVLPRFRAGDVEGGVVAGTQALTEQLGLETSAAEAKAAQAAQAQQARQDAGPGRASPGAVIILIFIVLWAMGAVFGGGRGGGMGWLFPLMFLGGLGGGRGYRDDGFGGGGGGGGFSGGGGGSFGGGGSSGSW